MNQKFMEQAEWLERTAKACNLLAKAIPNNDMLIAFQEGRPVLKGPHSSEKPDFVIFWDKDIRLGRHLEALGFKLFNRPQTIEICDDKTLMHQVLAEYGIRTPKTIIAPMVYEGLWKEDENYCEYLEDELSYPMVVKEAFGSFGAQVYMVNNREELKAKRSELKHRPHLYQELVRSSFGRDVRLQVVGDRVVAGMLRTSDKDFRANITAGGTMRRYEPSPEFTEFAVQCSRLVGAFFSGVDILFGKNGEPILCEINSNAHMRNIFECTGVDVTESIIRLVKSEVSNG